MKAPDEAQTSPTTAGHDASRRRFLKLSGGLAIGVPLLSALARGTVSAATGTAPMSPDPRQGNVLWYPCPAAADRLLYEGLALGNGHLGALTSGDPGQALCDLALASGWTGGRNDAFGDDGLFPYAPDNFGSFTRLAQLHLDLPQHAFAAVEDYRRELDLADGCARVSWRRDGAAYRRELFVSHPDRVLVWRMTAGEGARFNGRLRLDGTHGETTSAGSAAGTLQLTGRFANGLRHAVAVAIQVEDGRVTQRAGVVDFSDGRSLTLVLAAATNYAPTGLASFIDAGLDPLALVHARLARASTHAFDALRARHVADHRARFDTLQVDLGDSLPAQRKLDTWTRLKARARSGVPDPELEALFLQYGRYLTIAGSRDGLPTNLQGLWLARNDPPWNGDYHTDINLEMNYWLPDRAGLGGCFAPLADYCLAQLDAWTANTKRWFNDTHNPLRNTSGRIAGWTVAISTNPFGGFGWRWHPPGNAWLCNNLWHHYQYTLDRDYLARVFPLLEGACRFWQARLIETTLTDPATGQSRSVLIDDHDWSPEQGPDDARGITYAQELVWDLFGNYVQACAVLEREPAHARVIAKLRERLYLPRVSPLTGQLEEWMSPRDLGSPTHRHLSPLIGLFPGDRITPAASPRALVDGATRLLAARGMQSYGWANAWRALCWARLKKGDKAYQLLVNNLKPSDGRSNGTAANLFDVYQLGERGVFQIDANYGTPTAMLEMLLYSCADYIQLLPALPRAWPRGRVTGIGARGGFVVDLTWADGHPSAVTLHSIGGTQTVLVHAGRSLQVTLAKGASRTWQWPHAA